MESEPFGPSYNTNPSLNRVLLKLVLGCVAGIAVIITGHEQSQYTRSCYFHLFGALLASKESNYSELICMTK